jgi:hypothetical protein
MTDQEQKLTTAAAWAGRQQAFAVIASKCTVAQAQCLLKMREDRVYDHYGLTWDEFCQQHAGIGRSKADHLIHQLNEFGADYFRLSGLVNISDETYRAVAPLIHGETILLNGEKLALIPENATKIRGAIQSLRTELRDTQIDTMMARGDLLGMYKLLSEVVENFRRRARHPMPGDERDQFGAILTYAMRQLKEVRKEFDRPAV